VGRLVGCPARDLLERLHGVLERVEGGSDALVFLRRGPGGLEPLLQLSTVRSSTSLITRSPP
jgi:hypothetical protein